MTTNDCNNMSPTPPFPLSKKMVLRLWHGQALQFSTWFDETAQTFDLENLTQNRSGSLGQT